MSEQTRRVAAAFDDPREADEARRRLAEEHGVEVEDNAEADVDLAYEPTERRGDSAERPPDVTLAVEVPAAEVDEGVLELVDDGAEAAEVTESRPPA